MQFCGTHSDGCSCTGGRFIRTSPQLEDFTYGEPLDRLGLFSLEWRRLRDELLDVYKIVRTIDRGDNLFSPW